MRGHFIQSRVEFSHLIVLCIRCCVRATNTSVSTVSTNIAFNALHALIFIWTVSTNKIPYSMGGAAMAASSGFLLASNRLMLLQAGVLPPKPPVSGWYPQSLCRFGLTALASERIPNRMSTSHCVMTTLHLGRDDRGKENAVSPPFHTVSRFEL